MKILTKFSLFVLCMLCLTIGGVVLSVWSVRQADTYLKQINLANQLYIANLELSNHIYQLFKQFSDVLIVGRHGDDERKTRLLETIKGDFDNIRLLIDQEIKVVGHDETQELKDLEELEENIGELTSRLFAIIRSDLPKDDKGNLSQLQSILNEEIDLELRKHIEEALEEEDEEVAEIKEQAERQFIFHRNMSILFIIIAFITAGIGLLVIKRMLRDRLIELGEGADRFSAGEMSHRVPETGADELTGLATTLNQLAERVSLREADLKASNEQLEEKVQDRTRQLESLLGKVQKSEENRKRLMADVSHELRTPLTVIRGEADIALRSSKSTEEFREALSIVREAASHTARIVDDLLFVARNEAGEINLHLDDIDLLPMLQSFLISNSNHIKIKSEMDAVPLSCDKDRLRQAFLILVENARHYGGDDIHIRIEKDAAGYHIAVEDNGPGMSDEDKENAFERFFRGSNAAERYESGAGLGLPMAKSIIEAHSGKISLNDRPGGGLIVDILLPVDSSTAIDS